MTSHLLEHPQFYLTAPQTCPYLEGEMERKVFTYLVGEEAARLNNILSLGGFRRSQTIAYRPACERCRACLSVRVLAPLFSPTRNQTRVLKRNRDLIARVGPPVATSEQYELFSRYLNSRHEDGGMVGMSHGDYAEMIEETHIDTMVIEYRLRDPDSGITGRSTGDLVGVALTDRIEGGTSMVYSFFRPDMEKRSLGTFIILDHIRRAQQEGLDHVYLGYWVKNSDKMAYKSRFKPLEFLGNQGWELLE
ncbi:arginine-tRNA-protein transferase [Cohaesibacter sp. ES.047]|uniref:arginyltransferase n=1 Tax=Cohaesibacter sp. ES.047 TaxID=1798205 RepID=UPI000BB82280|nr:arginyltransferase [Cohaesibacter sp. ES.047]SNY93074.1 arginine-tRNA-protein transferase [Cohaesibacter sp. ES.047]